MKLDTAIEILDTYQCDLPRYDVPDLIDAIKLGIEAMKRIKDFHEDNELLPGEEKQSIEEYEG